MSVLMFKAYCVKHKHYSPANHEQTMCVEVLRGAESTQFCANVPRDGLGVDLANQTNVEAN
jgi:hypothetical protein